MAENIQSITPGNKTPENKIPVNKPVSDAPVSTKPNMDWLNAKATEISAYKEKTGQNRPNFASDYGKTDFASKYVSEYTMEEAEDLGINQFDMLQSNFDLNAALSEAQTGWTQTGRAIVGGATKGALAIGEYASYALDAEGWLGAFREFDDTAKSSYGKWLSEMRGDIQSVKKNIDDIAPIYSDNTGDFGWWMQGVQSVAESAVAFGAIGGAAGIGARSFFNMVLKNSPKIAEGLGRLGGAAIMNYVESRSMADEMYKNIKKEAILNGMSASEADELAKGKANQFIFRNKINIVGEALMFGKTLGGMNPFSGKAEGYLANKVLGMGKDAVLEGWEEVSSGYLQSAGEQEAGEQAGYRSAKSFTERASDYWGDGGLEDLVFGMMGGPLQAGAKRAISKSNDLVFNKTATERPTPLSGIDTTPPEFDKPTTPKDPGNLYDWMKKSKASPVDVDDAKLQQIADGELEDNRFDKDKLEYAAAKKEYKIQMEQIAAWDKHETNVRLKKKRDAEIKDFDETETLKNTGKIGQTVKDVRAAISQDLELDKDYQSAIVSKDYIAAENIADQRFENMFLRYAKRDAAFGKEAGSLEFQLKEAAKDNDPVIAASATRFLAKMDDLTKTLKQAQTDHGNTAHADAVFKTKVRAQYTKETVKQYADKLNQHRIDIAHDVKISEGADLSPVELEFIELRKEIENIRHLDAAMMNGKEGEFINKSLSTVKEAKIKNIEKRMAELEATNPDVAKDSNSIYSKNKAIFESFEKTLADKTNAWMAYQAFQKSANALDSTEYKNSIKKTATIKLNDAMDSSESLSDIDLVERGIEQVYAAGYISRIGRRNLMNALQDKRKEITDGIEERAAEEQRLQATVARLKDSVSTISDESVLESEIEDLEKQLEDNIKSKDINAVKIAALVKRLNYKTNKGKSKRAREMTARIQQEIADIESQSSLLPDHVIQYGINVKRSQLAQIQEYVAAVEELASFRSVTAKSFDSEYELILKGIRNGKYIPTNDMLKASLMAKGATKKQINKAISELENVAKPVKIKMDKNPDVINASFVESSVDGKVINPEPVGVNEDVTSLKHIGDANKIMYVSHTDDYKESNAIYALTDWLEANETDKAGTRVEYAPDAADLTNPKVSALGKKALTKLLNGETLTDHEMKEVPIRMHILDESGERMMVGETPVFGYMKLTSKLKTFAGAKESIAQRKAIIKSHLAGGTSITHITAVGNGMFKSEEQNHDPRVKMDKKGEEIKLLIHDGTNFLSLKRKGKRVRANDIIAAGTRGFLYAGITAPSGKTIPIRMNSRKVNAAEVDVIYNIMYDILVNKASMNTKMGDEFKGLTYDQVVNMLVFKDRNSLNGAYPFWIDTTGQRLFVGDAHNFISLNTKDREGLMKTNEKRIKDFLGTMWRTAHSDLINQKMSAFNGNDFIWFGEKIDSDMNYNDFMMDQGAIQTNGIFYNNRAFVGPSVTVAPMSQWENNTVDNLTPSQGDFVDKAKVVNDELNKDALVKQKDNKAKTVVKQANDIETKEFTKGNITIRISSKPTYIYERAELDNMTDSVVELEILNNAGPMAQGLSQLIDINTGDTIGISWRGSGSIFQSGKSIEELVEFVLAGTTISDVIGSDLNTALAGMSKVTPLQQVGNAEMKAPIQTTDTTEDQPIATVSDEVSDTTAIVSVTAIDKVIEDVIAEKETKTDDEPDLTLKVGKHQRRGAVSKKEESVLSLTAKRRLLKKNGISLEDISQMTEKEINKKIECL